jgi:hypothetical protein
VTLANAPVEKFPEENIKKGGKFGKRRRACKWRGKERFYDIVRARAASLAQCCTQIATSATVGLPRLLFLRICPTD